MDTITGTWEGTLISDDGTRRTRFALTQPPHATASVGPEFSIGGASTRTRLLDGAARSFVALAESPADASSGRFAQLLLEARVLGDRLVGRWLRRDECGHVVAAGTLSAGRA